MPNDSPPIQAGPAGPRPGDPDPVSAARPGLWVGIGSLAIAIVVAALVVPPLISPGSGSAPEATTPQPTASPPVTPAAATSAPPATPATPPWPTGSARGPFPYPSFTARPDGAPRGRPPWLGGRPPTTGTGFAPISVQAEAEGNVLAGGAGVAGCAGCDGGARVRYLGRLTVYLEVVTAGLRTVTVTYEADGNRTVDVTVGGGTPQSFTVAGQGWEKPLTFAFSATVPAGRVAVVFDSRGHPSPDIDKVTIS